MPWFLFASSVLNLSLALSLVRHFRAPGGIPFFGVLMGIVFYCFGYAMELITPPGPSLEFWNHFQYVGVATLPGFWLWLAVEAPMVERLRNPLIPLCSLLIPLVTLVLNWTNEIHHFYYASIFYYADGPWTRALITPGPWYWVHILFTLASFFLGTGGFFVTWKHHGPGSRTPYIGIIVAALPTLASFVLYQLKVVPGGFDLGPLGLSVTGMLYFWLLWPYRLFDLRPVAREAVFQLMADPVLVVDRSGRLVDWNPAAVELFPLLEPGGTNLVTEVFFDQQDWVAALSPGASLEPVSLPLDRGGVSWWSLTSSPVIDRQGRREAVVFLLHEQTELVQRAQVYQQLALTDELTGCLNRRAFLERAEALLVSRAHRGEPISLLSIDLDHFKSFNDQWGHAAGDAVLRHVVTVWQSQLRPLDMLGRLGGEEFSILLPGTRYELAVAIAGRLCQSLRERPLPWEGDVLHITGSFGVTGALDGSSTTVEELLRNADAALYEAKDRGRDRVVLGCLSDEDGTVRGCLEPD